MTTGIYLRKSFMKKVRFESPNKGAFRRMDESECHSPRPFIERQAPARAPDIYEHKRVVYSSDPVHRFEYSDSSPYPLAMKTVVSTSCEAGSNFLPSKDLNLSMLDEHEPRQLSMENSAPRKRMSLQPNVLSSIENTSAPPNILKKDDGFFIRKENLDKYNFNVLQKDINKLSIDKENDPLTRKAELAKMVSQNLTLPATRISAQNTATLPENFLSEPVPINTVNDLCHCHHCIKFNKRAQQCTNSVQIQKHPYESVNPEPVLGLNLPHPCQTQVASCLHCQQHIQQIHKICHCTQTPPETPQNVIDKKTWAIERFEQTKKAESMGVEKQINITKEKREPTIADLVKIIKLQNEQIQLLQEKVDKFITTSNNHQQNLPIQNYVTEHVALQTIDSHKISIGVMTSFEMVRTSTVINKEVLNKNENAQIQCNRSHVSITEVVSKQTGNSNFLDGIKPASQSNPAANLVASQQPQENEIAYQNGQQNDEKTLNELSLYNVQVDNSTTPQLSPDQSLYLDVRDYSDSDSVSSDDQSNVGWTYYNKVMTRVNGLLQDSDMPSSASALFRNTRQQCVQMQIDKSNVSVAKRVTFGNAPFGIHQPHMYAAASDTSFRMNQLAAKYLNHAPARPAYNVVPAIPATHEMSFATRKYMEKHKLLQGLPVPSSSPPPNELPRFLDITALKQQPKLL